MVDQTLGQRPIQWTKYPLRVCRWLNHCRLCDGEIRGGERYFDGGYKRRAHERCVQRGA